MPVKTAKKQKAQSKAGPDLTTLRRLLDFDRRKRAAKPAGMKTETMRYCLVGADEVGRGSLAGPVVAAAVLLPEMTLQAKLTRSLYELDDSKKLKAAQRERLAEIIKTIAPFAIGEASVEEIDEINILHASLLAMRRALEKLLSGVNGELPYLVLVDGHMKVPGCLHEQLPVVQGDGLSASIAAASILAKVHRDALMVRLSEEHPDYAWHQNKGYGSRAHIEALKTYGPTLWHRKVFCSKHIGPEQLSDEPSYLDDLKALDALEDLDEQLCVDGVVASLP